MFGLSLPSRADPGLILGCYKISQKNILQYDASNQRDFTPDYFE